MDILFSQVVLSGRGLKEAEVNVPAVFQVDGTQANPGQTLHCRITLALRKNHFLFKPILILNTFTICNILSVKHPFFLMIQNIFDYPPIFFRRLLFLKE